MTPKKLKQIADFAGLPLDSCDERLRRYFSRRLNNRQDVSELTQEVWLRLCRVSDRHLLREPMAYVYRTAANVLSEFCQPRRRGVVIFNTETADRSASSPTDSAPDELAERVQAQRDLLSAIAALPSAYRQIVWMRLCESKSFEEISAQVGFSPATTRRYYFHAVKRLWKAEWE
jgi:RNA polymerase sigma-70 factor (ECF subfamily)